MPSQYDLDIPRQRNDSPNSMRKAGLQRNPSMKERLLAKVLHPTRSASAQSLHPAPIERILSYGSAGSSTDSTRKTSLDVDEAASTNHTSPRDSEAGLNDAKTPQTSQLLKINAKITSELEILDVDTESSIWIAVDIQAETPSRYQYIPSTSLDVAVILDNSAYASPVCLQNACRSVLHIAKLLSQPRDRLAVLCTSYHHASKDAAMGGLLHPLRRPVYEALEEALQEASEQRPHISPTDIDLGETLVAACRILTQGRLEHGATGLPSRHVLILSANPYGHDAVLAAPLSPISVHIIEPGVIPWHSDRKRYSSGWSTSVSCLLTAKSPYSTIKSILDHARNETLLNKVRNLQIHVKNAGPGLAIEQVIGLQSYDTFSPGQIASVLVRIHVGRWKYATSQSEHNEVDMLLSELEGILGVASSELLNVIVTYEDNAADVTNNHRLEASCAIPRSNISSKWSCRREPSLEMIRRQRAVQSEVHKRLMICLANNSPPQQALLALAKHFSKSRYAPEVAASLSLIRAELEYQVELMAKYSLTGIESLISSFASTRLSLGPIPEVEVISTPPSPSSGSGRTVIHYSDDFNASREEDMPSSSDAARKIWKVMRKDSKPKNDLLISDIVQLNLPLEDNERMWHIKRKALASKRSIGADTLRSFSLGSGPGLKAPWL